MDLCNAVEFINHNLEEQTKVPRVDFTLAITPKPEDTLIGVITLNKIDYFGGHGTIGYWLNETHWRKGIMTEAAKRIIEFGFNELALRRINIIAFAENTASNALIRKLGFVFEGMERKGRRSKATGNIHDCNLYGMLHEEWLENEAKKEKN